MTRAKAMGGFVVIADGEVDQIVETRALANREKRDLERMGCAVTIKGFASMGDAETWADKRGAA